MTHAARTIRIASWMVIMIFVIALGACGNGGRDGATESLDGADLESPAETGAVDTTRLRETYDSIGEHYRQMMTEYDGMMGEMSSETERFYDQMQQHYGDVMPEGMMFGMMEPGSMGPHMMEMPDRSGWSREMLGLHQQMARLHARDEQESMAEMHERMVELYRSALEQLPDSGSGR